MKKLEGEEAEKKLATIADSWTIENGMLHRVFVFKNFIEAFSFMTSVAFLAEKLAHHPDLKNSYNKLTIDLSTHDAGGISTKDFELAKAIDQLL
jgi:4a-hydroxytetrahydrobiopterin dehydratase